MKKQPPLSEAERRKRLRRYGSKGGKARLKWTKAKRVHMAYLAGVQGGRPVRIDHAKVVELRDAGRKYSEIAAAMGISLPSVARILEQAGRVKKR